MKTRKMIVVFIVILSQLLSNVSTVYALPPLPSSFNGTVKLDGANVPDGTSVTAWMNGVQYASTTTITYGPDSVYALDVPGDDPNGNTGTTVVFHIGAITADQTGTWASGSSVTLNLTASTPLPPAATTNAASGITTTGATLNGTVNAHNASTTVTFQYGLTASYGSTVTAAQSPVTGTSNTAVSAAITGLTPNTLYHFRVVAVNATGTTNGSDLTFTTTAAAPAATTNAATAITTTGATLNGTVNANNASTTVTFQYGLSVAYGSTVTSTQSPVTGTSNTAVSAAITGLTVNTLYHFRVVAVNATGTTNGTDLTFTTTALAPTATTNAATVITTTSATLNGTVNANNASTSVTFQYGLTTSYGSTVTATQSPVTGTSNTPVNAVITGLTPNTLYHFRVVAVNATGTTNGLDLTFTTTAAAPAATTNAATAITTTGATLNGTVNANNASTTVTFQYGLTVAYGSTVTAAQSPVTGTLDTAVSAAITGLTPNTLYHFRVVAVNATGTTNGSDLTFTTTATAPAATTNAASGITTTGATLNGTVNANNASTTVTFQYGLTVAYGSTVTATQSPVTGTSNTPVSAVITGLTPNTLYHFRVVAVNATGTTNGLDLTFTTTAAAPAATTNAATAITTTGAALNGTVNANNASTTVTFQYGLTVAYGSTVTAAQSPVTGTLDTAVSAAITGLTPNTLYHFRVVAVNATGTTNGSDLTFTTTATAPAATTNAASGITTTGATLNGTVNANNASTTVTFQYGLTVAYGSTVTAAQSPVTGTSNTPVSAVITGLTPNTLYHFRVVAVNATGTTNGSDLTFTTTAAAPAATTNAATAITTTGATLNGTVNANNASTTVTFQYGLTASYGSTVTAAQSPVSGTNNTPVSADITGLTINTLYHFRVVAVNATGTTNGSDLTFTTTATVPTATTNAATVITTTGATLNGTVNANNASTTVTFQYGLTISYGSTVTAAQSPVTGTSNTPVSAVITGLTPNTLYHFRVVAVNIAGTTNGSDLTFTTLPVAPTVTTQPVTDIGTTTATGNGNVTVLGVPNPTQHGVVWNTAGAPTTADSKTTDGAVSATGPFTSAMTGLTPNTLYHVRAYATNTAGTAYGSEVDFTTLPLAPTVTTQAVTGIGNTTATGNGNITILGIPTPTQYGVVWGSSLNPTIALSTKTMQGTPGSTGPFTSAITGLTPDTLYHVRAYATNTAGTSYGADVTFTTLGNAPTVTTQAVTGIGTTSATGNGNITDLGIPNPTQYGVVWDTLINPTIALSTKSKLGVPGGTGAFTSPITPLIPNTLYHVRAYATNTAGTSYGADVTFTTNGVAPTVTTQAASNVRMTIATGNGNITDLGIPSPTQYGVVWDTLINPTIALNTKTTQGVPGNTGAFTSNITGLAPNTLYHVRAYATNIAGTSYGADTTFTTSIFVDVPIGYSQTFGGVVYPLYKYIIPLYDYKLTAGCQASPLSYCPTQTMSRAESSVFMLNALMGTIYLPPAAPWDTFADNWTIGPWAEKWAEGMWKEGLTAGCLTNPLRFCPWDTTPRVQAAVFGLIIMHGGTYTPTAAKGTVFADMTDINYWGTKWAEQAYEQGLLVACGTQVVGGVNKPKFCPNTNFTRDWAAYLIVKAKNMTPMP